MTLPIDERYSQLSYYTLSHKDSSFIHQHIVDASTAQMADAGTKPISLFFALAGLYLYLEKNYTGKQVQLVHMKMAKNKRAWPLISLPGKRGDITVTDVLSAPEGIERDSMIKTWCEAVWNAYASEHSIVIESMAHYQP